jgi:ABC-type amino acid transport substrate-binding protein
MAANALIVPKVGAMNRRIMERELQRDERKDAFMDRIKEKGEIVVAVNRRETPPFCYTSSDGDMRGLSIDVTKALAERLGVQWTPDTSAETDEDLISLVREEKVDVALSPYNFDQIYENELCYSAPYFTSQQGLSINRDALTKARTAEGKISVRNLTGDLGVVTSSIHGRVAGRLFDRMTAVEFESLTDAVDAVLSGEIAVVFGNEVELKHALSRRPASASSAVFLALKNREDSLRLAIAPQNRAFLEIFDTVIEEVRVTDTVDQLVVKYSE